MIEETKRVELFLTTSILLSMIYDLKKTTLKLKIRLKEFRCITDHDNGTFIPLRLRAGKFIFKK